MISTTAAYTAASGVIPASARGAGFGFLATGSLAGLALSPIVSGILGATSIRSVFLLDTLALVLLGGIGGPDDDRDAHDGSGGACDRGVMRITLPLRRGAIRR